VSRRALATLALLAAALGVACQRDAPTAQEQVLATFTRAEEAAESGEVGLVGSQISEAYRDPAGNDKQAIEGLLALHVLRQRRLHLLTRVVSLEIATPDEARAEVLVAMAAAPVDDPGLLTGVRADLYRFELVLRDEDGAWRVVSAQWRPAALDDFR